MLAGKLKQSKQRNLKPSNRLAMHTYLQEVDAHTLVGNAHGCTEKVTTFQSIIQHGLDSVLLLRSKMIHSRDPPWVNPALIDHALLARKLLALDMPVGISFWIIDFLTDGTQRVKLGEDCLSEWRNVPAGVPQGTKLGPWLFILMIDDINTSNTELWKYVDDTTIAECVDKKEDSRIQSDVEELIAKSNQNKFQLNESKCKELRISFAKSAADFAPIVINGKAIEVVSTVKLLGLNISSDLRWNCHVAEISKKVASRLYFLKVPAQANFHVFRSYLF